MKKVYVLTANLFIWYGLDKYEPHFELLGVFDSKEKAEKAKDEYIIEMLSEMFKSKDETYLREQEEYDPDSNAFCINEVELNQRQKDIELEYEFIG